MTDMALGIVANPKLRKPLLAMWDDGSEIDIYLMNEVSGSEGHLTREGSGYYETNGGDYDEPARITGLPRVHTPTGVWTKGMGNGTALYTGLALGAHMQAENLIRLDTDYDGDGISSKEGDRSREAERWWTEAIRRKLADRVEDEQEQDDVDVTYDVSGDLAECLSIEGSVTGVNNVNVNITQYVEADAYPYDNADSANLIVAIFKIPVEEHLFVPARFAASPGEGPQKVTRPRLIVADALWRKVAEDESLVEEVDMTALLALDVRGLTKSSMHLLNMLMDWSGASEAEREGVRQRWAMNLDPAGTAPKQLELALRKNPAGDLEQALLETAEARDETGWDALSDLP